MKSLILILSLIIIGCSSPTQVNDCPEMEYYGSFSYQNESGHIFLKDGQLMTLQGQIQAVKGQIYIVCTDGNKITSISKL